MARCILSALSGDNPTLRVFAQTFLVHLHAPGGWGITLPWLKDSKPPKRELNMR